ncbi:MAG: dethiobiotin synthase [Cyanobacteriota bacterium]|nr:dethiobiotin synthase [Cyanobacteriota bacterium]
MSMTFAPPQAPALLIAGTDTGVGKTVLTSALAAYRRRFFPAQSLGLMKLMQTGVGDREWYQDLFGADSRVELSTPLQFSAPLAPPLAARQEGKRVDLAPIWQGLTALQNNHSFVLVEGLGSLGSPVTEELTLGDLAGLWRVETVLVVGVKLGCLGQALAQTALARQVQVNLRGFVLSCAEPESQERLEDWANIPLLESLSQLPVLGVVPYLQKKERQDLNALAQGAAHLDLEKLGWGIR